VRLDDDRTTILRVLRAYHAAMVDARTEDLSTLLDDEFSLVHITGYRQPQTEWFGAIQSGRFDYHRIDVEEESVSVMAASSTAEANGRGIFDATVEGLRRPWRLRFAIRLSNNDGGWRIVEARYATF
jgi:hypothetical protein